MLSARARFYTPKRALGDRQALNWGAKLNPIMAKKKAVPLPSTRVLDHPASLSLYERESLAAEAKLAAEKTKKPAKARP